jgi:hypothetical protein
VKTGDGIEPAARWQPAIVAQFSVDLPILAPPELACCIDLRSIRHYRSWKEDRKMVFKLQVTALGVLLCTGLGFAFQWLYAQVPYLAFLPIIIASCAFGGVLLAAWSGFLSVIALWFFFVAFDDVGTDMWMELTHLCAFVVIVCSVCWIVENLRRSNQMLERDNIGLGIKVSLLLEKIKRI